MSRKEFAQWVANAPRTADAYRRWRLLGVPAGLLWSLGYPPTSGLAELRGQLLDDVELWNWILMADPEGNEFCVCDGGSSSG